MSNWEISHQNTQSSQESLGKGSPIHSPPKGGEREMDQPLFRKLRSSKRDLLSPPSVLSLLGRRARMGLAGWLGGRELKVKKWQPQEAQRGSLDIQLVSKLRPGGPGRWGVTTPSQGCTEDEASECVRSA